MVGKFFAESIEPVDIEPVEAVQAAGASRMQPLLLGILPQVLPQMADISLYSHSRIGGWAPNRVDPQPRTRGSLHPHRKVCRLASNPLWERTDRPYPWDCGHGSRRSGNCRTAGRVPLEIIYSDPISLSREKELGLKLRRVSLEELLGLSQFVIVAAPLRPDTVHLLNAEAISKMKKGSFLINVGRGSVVDEQVVAEALARGHLSGYGADVFEMEDWSRPDHPGTIPAQLLRNESQTLFTPHLGSAVDAVRKEIEMEAAENILLSLNGVKPRGAVNLPFSKTINDLSSP